MRQIVSTKLDNKHHYIHGQMNYDPSNTKVYDLRTLDFGNLEKGESSDEYVANFNIIDVVKNLYELRNLIKSNTIRYEE